MYKGVPLSSTFFTSLLFFCFSLIFANPKLAILIFPLSNTRIFEALSHSDMNKPFNQIEEANKICNPPQPDPSHSLSLLSWILSLVSAMAEPMVLLVSGGDKTTTVREGFGMSGEKRYRDWWREKDADKSYGIKYIKLVCNGTVAQL